MVEVSETRRERWALGLGWTAAARSLEAESMAGSLSTRAVSGTSERFWLNLQSRYDLEREKDKLAESLDRIHPLASA